MSVTFWTGPKLFWTHGMFTICHFYQKKLLVRVLTYTKSIKKKSFFWPFHKYCKKSLDLRQKIYFKKDNSGHKTFVELQTFLDTICSWHCMNGQFKLGLQKAKHSANKHSAKKNTYNKHISNKHSSKRQLSKKATWKKGLLIT